LKLKFNLTFHNSRGHNEETKWFLADNPLFGSTYRQYLPLHVQWLLLSLSEAFPALRSRDVAISVKPYHVPLHMYSSSSCFILQYIPRVVETLFSYLDKLPSSSVICGYSQKRVDNGNLRSSPKAPAALELL
jgi:hypothetical protein